MDTAGAGGGGTSGTNQTLTGTSNRRANGGTQTAGGACPYNSTANGKFGKGGQFSSLTDWYNGGGGGLYGGGAGWCGGGAGGSGYIGGVVSGATSNDNREGNGYARITRVSA